ncbi:MAG: NAD(P)H-dependent glycerol-3-phosphate dehydrogenase [Candidatus Goldbacteria bacterium]|nr:NAD(P)H-dependent glycerol-3-phosphate dehydrogenase [Candidatus Goldiibacteriota bacterium]
MNVSVIGAGGWGTTLSLILNERHNNVILFEYFKDYAEQLLQRRENYKFLKGIKIPRDILITNDLKLAIESSEIIVLAVPSHFMRNVLLKINKFNCRRKLFISVTKGIEQRSLLTMSRVIKEIIKDVDIAVLSGPSLAAEVARKVPTTVVAASEDISIAKIVQSIFFTNYFRVYTNEDVLGVEIGGALKNVIAIAAGILDGLGIGDNTKAGLITRGLAEIRRLGVKMGAKDETFFGLSGLGDLVVTCSSKLSRNRMVGEELGKGKKIKEILKNMEMVAEGVKTTLSAYRLSKKYKVEMPITEEVYNVLYKNKSIYESMADLMSRSPKSENEFLS